MLQSAIGATPAARPGAWIPSAALGAKLIHEANQISRFFEAQRRTDAVEAVADHLAKFWAPWLRRALLNELQVRNDDLRPTARAAILRVARDNDDHVHQGSPTMPDSELETRLKTAIAAAPALRNQSIHLTVEADRVVIAGTIDSAPDRVLLDNIVKNHTGLRVVDDQLRVVRPEPSA